MRHILILSIFFIIISCNQKNGRQNDYPNGKFSADTSGDRIYTTDAEDTGMNNAITAARQTLIRFDNALQGRNDNFQDFALKKRFAVGDSGEHIWISQVEFYKKGYRGVINNDPVIVKGIKPGDTVYVNKEEISDWMYLDKNVLRGGYTIRLELKRMTTQERTSFIKDLGYKIEE